MQNRKEITKKQYVFMSMGIIIIGLISYCSLVYIIMMSGIESSLMRVALFLGIAGIIVGFGVGLSMAYYFKIKDYAYWKEDKMNEKKAKKYLEEKGKKVTKEEVEKVCKQGKIYGDPRAEVQ